jgi:aspartate-semialdehyde dehydrogenase
LSSSLLKDLLNATSQLNRLQQASQPLARASSKLRIEVGILGATGNVGQQFLTLLENHPWFRVAWLAASERWSGKRYGEVPWRLPTPCSAEVAKLPVEASKPGLGPRLVFSALDASIAGEVEADFALKGHWVVSNSRNHRMDPLVPLLVPEINPEHLGVIPHQQEAKRWNGAIVTNPNCSTVFLAMALAALRRFRPRRTLVTTLQALSGAGYPGVASLDATANVVPFIRGEEEKIESETNKILGRLAGQIVEPDSVVISAQTTRVPVIHGHTETVSVELGEPASRQDILTAFQEFTGEPQKLGLPSAPAQPIVYLEAADRPQPRLDVDNFAGMAVQVGRLRACPVLGHKFVLLGHNMIRGAAGGALLNAELMYASGLLG